jgi:hypothetical protein
MPVQAPPAPPPAAQVSVPPALTQPLKNNKQSTVVQKTMNPTKNQVKPKKRITKPLQPKAQQKQKDAELAIDDGITELDIVPRKVYDYRDKALPPNISKKQYSKENQHLPKSFFYSEYSKLLFVAVMDNDIGAVKALIDKGADINAVEAKNANTPLMTAVIHNKNRVMRYLIVRGAQVNQQNIEGKTALHLAAINNNIEAFQVLISSGVNNMILDQNKKKAISYLSNR